MGSRYTTRLLRGTWGARPGSSIPTMMPRNVGGVGHIPSKPLASPNIRRLVSPGAPSRQGASGSSTPRRPSPAPSAAAGWPPPPWPSCPAPRGRTPAADPAAPPPAAPPSPPPPKESPTGPHHELTMPPGWVTFSTAAMKGKPNNTVKVFRAPVGLRIHIREGGRQEGRNLPAHRGTSKGGGETGTWAHSSSRYSRNHPSISSSSIPFSTGSSSSCARTCAPTSQWAFGGGTSQRPSRVGRVSRPARATGGVLAGG